MTDRTDWPLSPPSLQVCLNMLLSDKQFRAEIQTCLIAPSGAGLNLQCRTDICCGVAHCCSEFNSTGISEIWSFSLKLWVVTKFHDFKHNHKLPILCDSCTIPFSDASSSLLLRLAQVRCFRVEGSCKSVMGESLWPLGRFSSLEKCNGRCKKCV